MKSVLISIQPKWCELIARGEKTVEIRKTKPKLETSFKVYIYCTNNKQGTYDLLEIHGTDGKIRKANGKVIGEFVCSNISKGLSQLGSCLTMREVIEYANGKVVYGWNISDLVIYDKPKELSEFRTLCKYRNNDGSCQYTKVECDCINFDYNPDYSVNFAECCDFMIRPPQPWCYVEELG